MARDVLTVTQGLRRTLLDDFKAFYSNASADSLDGLEKVYTQDIEFRDPIHAIMGLLALKTYLRGLYKNSSEISFEYLDEQLAENGATITWNMRFRHKRLNSGKPVNVRGITQLYFTDRVYYQEDFYDLGAMLYQHVPVLGRVIRFLNARLQD